ncbi:MAG: tetratricopeptide repeat protein [Candidatus Latescibacteria bacterium]|nr:tetratricopeptide repeat protein [Candidatus Latescibacterota bacterium]
MRHIVHAIVVALSLLILAGWSVAMQPQDSHDSDPEGMQFESPDPVRSDVNPLIEGRRLLKKGVSQNDLDAMYSARAIFERALTDTVHSVWGHYYVGLADYRIANVLLAQGEKSEADASEHLRKAVKHLQIAKRAVDNREEINEIAAEVCALLSNVYGRQISLSPIKGIYLGPKAKSVLGRAEQLAHANPRVVLSSAMSYLMTPRLVGGNKAKAMAGFRHAANLFAREKPVDPIRPVWGHSDTYIWMGVAYLERRDRDAAREAFKKALEIDPDSRWAREMLSGDSAR